MVLTCHDYISGIDYTHVAAISKYSLYGFVHSCSVYFVSDQQLPWKIVGLWRVQDYAGVYLILAGSGQSIPAVANDT